LKTCEDYTFLREGKLWPLIFGLSMCLIHWFPERTVAH
jgi:hypothetical protein